MFEPRSGWHPRVITAFVATGAVLVVLGLLLLREATYRRMVVWASGLPQWVQSGFSAISDYGVFALAGLYLLALLVARGRGTTSLARGIAAGIGVFGSYLASELFKVLVTEQRPCRTFSVETIATCPAPPDWSWPSNHTTVAVAIAVAVLTMSVRIALTAIPLALLIGLSRVVLGVHYFHDVLSGAILGTAIVIIAARWGTSWVQKGLDYIGGVPTLGVIVTGRAGADRSR